MVYLDNKKDPQEVWIPRNDGNGYVHTGSSQSYQEGYEDGIEYQKSLLSSSAFTENGEYERENGWSAITVNVPQSGSVLEGKEIVVSQDVTIVVPTSGYGGFSAVTVDATEYGQTNYDSGFDDGFTDGYSSGASEGYDSGYTEGYQSGSTDGYESGYTSGSNDGYESGYTEGYNSGYTSGETDGYNSGYTSGETNGFNSGYTSGETHQKSLLVSTAITQNGSYQRENGYSAITVNVPQTGSTAVLGLGSFSANGTYSASTDNLDGYSAITVNVPTSGESEIIICSSGQCWFDFDYTMVYGDYIDIEHCTFGKIGSHSGSSSHQQLIGGGTGEWFRIGQPSDNSIYFKYFWNNVYEGTFSNNPFLNNSHLVFSKDAITIDGNVFTSYTTTHMSFEPIIKVFANDNNGSDKIKNQTAKLGTIRVYGADGTLKATFKPMLDEFNVPFFKYVEEDIDIYALNGTPTYEFIGSSDYQSGYTNGYNSGYTDGYNSGATEGYESGYTDAEIDIVATFSSMTATTNGVYGSSAHPMSSITVNVPQTGHTEQEMEDAYDSGYTSGYTDGYDSGYTSGQTDGQNSGYTEGYNSGYTEGQNDVISTFSSITITENGQYGDSAHPMSSITVNVPQSGSSLTLIHPTRERNINGTKTYYAYAYAPSIEYYSHKEGSYTVVETDAFFYPNTGYFDLLNVSTQNQEDGFISIYYQNGDLLYDSTEWNGGTIICTTGNSQTADSAGTYDWMLLKLSVSSVVMTEGADADLKDKYAMSAITIVTNVDTASTYQSGYTDGSASIASLIDRSITSAVIPNGCTKIGSYAFGFCESLSSVTIPNTVTEIGNYAFTWNIFSAITIPSGCTKIGNNAFSYTKLSAITIPNSVTSIGSSAFASCSNLSSVIIPNSVTSIGNNAFASCSKLPSITLPSGITKIEQTTFRYCSALTNIYISATTAPTISNANAFQGVPSTGTVHYPQGSDYSSWQSNTYLSGWTFIADL